MAWSAENATKAYLRTLKLGNKGVLEPDVAEFISALAAGTGARLMVEVCGDSGAGPTTLALIAAANQTGGHAVCILRGPKELHLSARFLGPDHSRQVDLVIGDAEELLLREYRGADFVLVDCKVYDSERMFKAAQCGAAEAAGGGVVVGYNAMCGGSGDRFNDSSSGRRGGMKIELLPIGGGLRVCRVPPAKAAAVAAAGRRSRWVVRVDEGTGEEHVFRITSVTPQLPMESPILGLLPS